MIVGLIIFLPIFAADTWFDMDMEVPTLAVDIFTEIKTQPVQTQEWLVRDFIQEGLQANLPLVAMSFAINDTCCVYPRDFPEYPIVEDLGELRNS